MNPKNTENTHIVSIYLFLLLHGNIDQTLMNALLGVLNCLIGGLGCHVITIEYRTRVHCIQTLYLFCNALVHVI